MLDPALRGFVEAASDEEAEQRLESLIEGRVAPLVRRIVARKLSAYGPRKAFAAEDLEDVASDAVLVLLKRLRVLRAHPGVNDIERLDDYTAAATYSACAHHIRRRYPERSRLKNRVRYVVGRDERFALWEGLPGVLYCGLSRWRGLPPDAAASGKLADLEQMPERWPASWKRPALVERADPAPLIAAVLDRVGGPIEFDSLVGLVAAVWQVDRINPPATANLFERLSDTGPEPELAIDRRRFAARLWEEVQQLPLRQRWALLMNLRDSQGAGMLWIFPVTGVASLRAIAGALEISAQDLASLWNRLPMDDTALAARLACTRQQVINLRMSARKRLTNRLGPPESPRGVAKRPANLGDISISLGSDT
jgi:hypothetical protein